MMAYLHIETPKILLHTIKVYLLELPGAVLYFHDDVLTLSTRHYLRDTDYIRVSEALQKQLLAEEEKLHIMKKSLRRMEEEVFKRLWEMSHRD